MPELSRRGLCVHSLSVLSRLGYVRKADGRTTVVLEKEYGPGLLRLERHTEIWVLWCFDRNDTPEKNATLQVNSRGKSESRLTGVFATHSPIHPNLITMTQCKVISVQANVIGMDSQGMTWSTHYYA